MVHFSILEVILCVFLIALFVTVIFRQLKLSVILGYLIVGAVVGPHALGIVSDTPDINALAEFGIVFLMFTIGLEFSLPKLLALKSSIFITGAIQVLLSVIITTFVGKLLGMSTLSALVTGSIVAMSSTAIVGKQLNDQLELYSPHGLNALGILLLQDLAVVLLIILIAGLTDGQTTDLGIILWQAILKGILAITLIFTAGRWLLKPLFRIIAKTRAIELFTLSVLLVTLSAAWITNILGLSFALGAFLAGMMLGETEFRHQIAVEIRPFRDILLGLFFITIGMLTDIGQWYHTWQAILLLFLALTVGKMLLIAALTRLTGSPLSTAYRTGLILAQGGEFGFALLTLALNENILSTPYSQIILAALLLSIVIAPIIIRFNKQIVDFFLPNSYQDPAVIANKIDQSTHKLKKHIIICGYGRVGQHIARLLEQVKLPYLALDLDAELIQRANLAGENVMYGDASHPGILKAAQLEQAKILVISFNDLHSAIRILSIVRPKLPHLPIIVRCRDNYELRILKEQGATQVIAELFEESLTLSYHLLQLVNISPSKIAELMQEVRKKDYDLLQKIFIGDFNDSATFDPATQQQLRPILIPADAYAVNRSLNELGLKALGIEVVAVRRGHLKQVKPHSNIKLRANDILILYGKMGDLETAKQKLLAGDIA